MAHMTKYDKNVVLMIAALSLSVAALMFLGALLVEFPFYPWFLLPLGWFIGAMMVWFQGKHYPVQRVARKVKEVVT